LISFSDGLRILIELKPNFSTMDSALLGHIMGISFLNISSVGIWQWSGNPWVNKMISIALSITISFFNDPLKNHSPGGNIKSP